MTIHEMFRDIEEVLLTEQHRLETDAGIIKHVHDLSDSDYMAQMMVLTDEITNGHDPQRRAAAYVLRQAMTNIHYRLDFYGKVVDRK